MSKTMPRLIVLTAMVTTVSYAQPASGTILGTGRDSQQATVPGAKVRVTNVANNIAKVFTTGSSGQYTVPYLLPGNYSVSVEAAGFRRANRTGIRLNVDDRLTLDFDLEVGAPAEQLTVQ